MRPLFIQVPKGNADLVLEMADKVEAKNIAVTEGRDAVRAIDIIHLYVSNRRVEQLIGDLEKIENLKVTIIPQGVFTLYPPPDEAPDQVTDVELRSPIEIFLAGLQSIGSWKGFVGYALIASIVVWIGLFTNTVFLLVAAMLIAPFAGPAMNTAIATARGDWFLMKKGVSRYFVAIFATVGGAFVLSLIFGQEIATPLMVERSQISSVTVLLALSAGAAGAMNLVQSERDSLVSGAATGMLIAASLAPPAGVVGMALAIGEWPMVKSGVFLLLLQLIGINLTGSIVFKIFGLSPSGARYNRGKKKIIWLSISFTVLALAAMMFWQFNQSPNLQRSSKAQRVNADVKDYINKEYAPASLIESNVRFTRASIENQTSLLVNIYVQKSKITNKTNAEIKQELTRELQQEILKKGYNVTPLVNVTVLEEP